VTPDQGREVVRLRESPQKAGGARAFSTRRAKGFDEVIELMPELHRRFLAMAMTALGSRKMKSLGLSERFILPAKFPNKTTERRDGRVRAMMRERSRFVAHKM
jgi:hypothetical protein